MRNRASTSAWTRALRAIGLILALLLVGEPGTFTDSARAETESPRSPQSDEAAALAADLRISYAESRRALDITEDVNALNVDAQTHYPDAFAGLWRDYQDGGRINLAFTDGQGRARAEALLRHHSKLRDLVDVIEHKNTWRELRALADELAASDWREWRQAGVVLNRVAADPASNRVIVAVEDDLEGARQTLESHFGRDRLAIVEEPAPIALVCERASCLAEPFRAGLIIDYVEQQAPYSCSTAFTASRGGRAGVLTAGHCQTLDGFVLHSGNFLGNVAWQEYGGNQDAEWIQISPTWPMPNRGWVWQLPGSTQYSITSVMDASGGSAGDPICHSGWRRGYRCGTIVHPSVSIRINDGSLLSVRVTDMVQDDICAAPGDSGGPTYSAHKAHGIISAGNTHRNQDGSYRCDDIPRAYYSKIAHAEADFGVRVTLE